MGNIGRRRGGPLAPEGIRSVGGFGTVRGSENSGDGGRVKVRTPKMKFNDQQREALEHNEGPILVSAGPGSGKTRIIVARIARMIEDGIEPRSILATTFTAKAAEEMNQRLNAYGVDTGMMSIQTMHSFCNRLLQREVYKRWELAEENRVSALLKQVIGFCGMRWNNADLSLVANFISLAKNSLIRPEQSADSKLITEDPFFGDTRYAVAYFEFEEIRRQRRLYTFDDMLIDAVELLRDSQTTRAKVQERFEWVIVDEFQDSNLAQVKLVHYVAHPHWNLMVVGDVDQAIYEWRGAVPKFMTNFADTFDGMPKHRIVSMGINYRSAPEIVDAASKCIANNQDRITKELSANKTKPAYIKAIQTTDLDEEANFIADEITSMHDADGIPYGTMFIVYRTNAQSRAIEEVFSRRKIPHIVLGASSFYQRKEIQDILSYLRLIVDPMDIESGERAINRPFRYISKDIVGMVVREAEMNGITFEHAADIIARQRGSSRIDQFLDVMTKLRDLNDTKDILNLTDTGLKTSFTIGSLISLMVKETNFIQYLESNEGSDTAENSREANVGELIRSADRYKDVKEFLDFVNWQIAERKKKKKKSTQSVTCMTIHKAKGLEARVVFVIGVNEGLLPHAKASEPKEEERRLFYVAITRAMERLYITSIEHLGMDQKFSLEPSRFIEEAGIELSSFHPDGDLFAGIEEENQSFDTSLTPPSDFEMTTQDNEELIDLTSLPDFGVDDDIDF